MKNYFALLAFAAALVSCNISKKMTADKPATPQAYRVLTAKADTNLTANAHWKQFFGDAALQNLIDSAVSRNLDLKLALSNVKEAGLLYKQVKWNYVPQAALNVTQTVTRPSDNSFTGLSLKQYGITQRHVEDYSANVSLSWEADIWSKIQKQSISGYATYLETDEARRALQTAVVATVAQGYYNLLMLKAQLQIASRNLSLNDTTLRIIRLQFDAGQVTLLAVQQAAAQAQLAAQLISQYEENISIQENALHVLTGSYPAQVVTSATLEGLAVQDQLSAGFPAKLLDQRPDVKASELALVAASAKVALNKAFMYPSLQITASGGVNSFTASNWFNIPASLFGIVQGSLITPLIARKQLLTQYRIAQVEREKAVTTFKKSVLVAVREVSDALVSIEKLKVQKDVAAARVGTLQQATKNSKALFAQGLATYLEVITAQANVLQSELVLATIRRDHLTAVSELYRALGGGWK